MSPRILASLLCMLGLSFSLVSADPAKKLTLSLSGDTLSLIAQHKVKDPATHFIQTVSITLGDSLVAKKDYSRQTDGLQMVERFVLPAKLLAAHPTIYVQTVCNKYGEKSARLATGSK
jgi:hypothetical protein